MNRIIYYDGTDPSSIRASATALGCSTEWDEVHTLISVSVPSNDILPKLRKMLDELCEQDKVDEL